MATILTNNRTHVTPEYPAFPGCAQAITTSNTDVFASPVSVYVGGGGDVAVRPWNNPAVSVVFKNLPAGSMLPVRVIGVDVLNTTATNLVAVY